MNYDNDIFINNVIKAIKNQRWNELQVEFAKLAIQIPENAPSYHNLFEILMMAITLANPNTKTCYSNSKDLPDKMINRVKKLRNG